MDTDLWGLALLALGGFLAGGAYTLWKVNRVLGTLMGACVVLAVAAGVLRLGYFQ